MCTLKRIQINLRDVPLDVAAQKQAGDFGEPVGGVAHIKFGAAASRPGEQVLREIALRPARDLLAGVDEGDAGAERPVDDIVDERVVGAARG